MTNWIRWIIAVAMIAVLLPVHTASQPVEAQGTVEDIIFAVLARNLGFSPPPTKGAVDRGEDLTWPLSYRTAGLDLNGTGGVPSCSARVLAEGETIRGFYGFRIRVSIQGRTYEFRTNSGGGDIIRCSGGRQVDLNFGAAPPVGAVRTGDEVTDAAMRHLSGYLGLSPIVTLADVRAFLDGETEEYPYRVAWNWGSRMYTNGALNCPASGQTYSDGDMVGYQLFITVDGRTYQYRASSDASILILCLGTGPDPSSLGVVIPVGEE